MKISNKIAAGTLLVTLTLAAGAWAFKMERNTARTALSIEMFLARLPAVETGVSDNKATGKEALTRLNDHDRRLDGHDRIFETILKHFQTMFDQDRGN
jgi:hypothetical protein